MLVIFSADAYMANPDIENDDMLSDWASVANTWKKFDQVAKYLLGIPAASMSSECTFFIAGRRLNDIESQSS
jgi:hypothetical protein